MEHCPRAESEAGVPRKGMHGNALPKVTAPDYGGAAQHLFR
jgi:hypothetical protein